MPILPPEARESCEKYWFGDHLIPNFLFFLYDGSPPQIPLIGAEEKEKRLFFEAINRLASDKQSELNQLMKGMTVRGVTLYKEEAAALLKETRLFFKEKLQVLEYIFKKNIESFKHCPEELMSMFIGENKEDVERPVSMQESLAVRLEAIRFSEAVTSVADQECVMADEFRKKNALAALLKLQSSEDLLQLVLHFNERIPNEILHDLPDEQLKNLIRGLVSREFLELDDAQIPSNNDAEISDFLSLIGGTDDREANVKIFRMKLIIFVNPNHVITINNGAVSFLINWLRATIERDRR